MSIVSYTHLTEFVRILSKYRKKYPSAVILSLSKNKVSTTVALGYIKISSLTDSYIKDEDILTPKEHESVDPSLYTEVIVLG